MIEKEGEKYDKKDTISDLGKYLEKKWLAKRHLKLFAFCPNKAISLIIN